VYRPLAFDLDGTLLTPRGDETYHRTHAPDLMPGFQFGFAVEDQKFQAPRLVVDDQLIIEPLRLPLPREHVAIELVDIPGPIRGFLLRDEEPDGVVPGWSEDACIEGFVCDLE
jgi:hypothetical protein